MADLHITLLSAAVAAIMNLWLSLRCGKARIEGKVLHGDGGHVPLQRHMRAHANYVEYTPFALLLILLLDFSDQDGWLLGLSAAAYFLARMLHPLGMQADHPAKTRQIGIGATFVLLLFWSVWAVLVALRLV